MSQQEIIELLESIEEGLTTKQIAELIDISLPAIRSNLRGLIKSQVVIISGLRFNFGGPDSPIYQLSETYFEEQ